MTLTLSMPGQADLKPRITVFGVGGAGGNAVNNMIEKQLDGVDFVVANTDGDFHACTNTCPHAGGPLGEGSIEGSVLTCPYHGWQFDLADGSCLTNAEVKLTIYDVAVVDDAVCVRI